MGLEIGNAVKALIPDASAAVSDSMFIDILEDGLPAYEWKQGLNEGSVWFWYEWTSGIPASLAAGEYTLRIQHREDGIQIDEIAISADPLDL